MDNLATLILAGGRSSRMGHDKAMLAHGDGTLLSHMASLAIGSKVYVSGDYPDYDNVLDLEKDKGPIAGIFAVIKNKKLLHSDIKYLLVLPIDMPFLRKDILEILVSKLGSSDSDAAYYKNFNLPFCFKINQEVIGKLENCVYQSEDKDRSISALFKTLSCNVIELQKGTKICFSNINTREEYEDKIASK